MSAVSDGRVRDVLARLATRPAKEWANRLAAEFPSDPSIRAQALLWLHSEKNGPELDGSPPSLGDTADERYELNVRLDRGATASVWRAYDRRLGRNVAIKVFHRDESEALDQVLAEARAASDVISDHVVRVLDVNHGDAHPYIVMELVGEYDPDKGEVVRGTAASATRPRSIDEVARWVMQVACGVHDAHLRNVFHRDLKPKNVLVTPISRRARIADFGLAVSGDNADVAQPAITLLKGGPSGPLSVRGTPEFMAPEQARGLPLTLDSRAAVDRAILVSIDVWGLGAIAYDLLAGRPPWLARADRTAWEVAASDEHPPTLERTRDGQRIPARLRRVIEKTMSIDPASRYATAAALAHELEAYLARRPTSIDRSRLSRFGLWCRRNPQLALTGLVTFAITAIAVGTHVTVEQLRDERRVLDLEVRHRKAEESALRQSVDRARTNLHDTQEKLRAERENLATLEQTIDEDRKAHGALLEAKEQELRHATAETRAIVEQLEAARRDRRTANEAKAALEKLVIETRREAERAAKERDRLRREREAARVERDAMQKELDTAISERDAAEAKVRDLEGRRRSTAGARSSP